MPNPKKRPREPYNNHSWEVILKAVMTKAAEGGDCYQKYSCGQCGTRLGMDEPNKFYTHGTCDLCGHTTDIKKAGMNYLLSINAHDRTPKQITVVEWSGKL
jgi:hypothetical protein